MRNVAGVPSEPCGQVLVVDDHDVNRDLVTEVLEGDHHRVSRANDGTSALAAIEAHAPDVIILDVGLPDIDGFEVCRRIKSNPSTRLIPVVMVTGNNSQQHRIQGIKAGADDFLGKPFDPAELLARVRSLVRLKRYTDELETADEVILSLGLTAEARDPYTEGHCQRLARYASAMGRELQLRPDEVSALDRGGYLHDVGKVGIPDLVLNKVTKLTPAEFELMKEHTIIGERLCGRLRSLALVRPIVRHHHERLDGSGYPDGLRHDHIPLLAQIVGIVDTYDAITTARPYRPARSAERAYEELNADAAKGRQRRDLVDTFIALGRSGGLSQRQAAADEATAGRGAATILDGVRATSMAKAGLVGRRRRA